MKRFKSGMYGGKFMPFHKGHLHCVMKALEECEKVHVLLMVGGNQEKEILKNCAEEELEYLAPEKRFERVTKVFEDRNDVIVHMIDISDCIFEDGSEDWDAETPLVLERTGEFEAVYGSEPSYVDYFNRAYPKAEYRVVDVDRNNVPISGTEVRKMSKEERAKWVV